MNSLYSSKFLNTQGILILVISIYFLIQIGLKIVGIESPFSKETVFSYPQPLKSLVFDFLCALSILLSTIGILLKKRYALLAFNMFLAAIISLIIFKQISLISRYIGYFNWPLFGVLLLSSWLLFFLTKHEITSKFSKEKDLFFMQKIVIGGFIISTLWVITHI